MLTSYEGYFEKGKFISADKSKIPERRKAIVTIIEEESEEDIVKAQSKAFEEFMKAMKEMDEQGIEPLGEEFDEIMSHRVNITRELDL